MIPLSSLSKLYHETDCHRFHEYKHKKPLWNHLGTAEKLKVPRKNIPWAFFQEPTHPFIEMSSRGSYNSQKFTLIIFFTSKESLPTGNLLRHTWNTHFKHLLNTGSLKYSKCKLLHSQPLKAFLENIDLNSIFRTL